MRVSNNRRYSTQYMNPFQNNIGISHVKIGVVKMRTLTLLVCFMLTIFSLDAVWKQCDAQTYDATGTWNYSFTNIIPGPDNPPPGGVCVWNRNTTGTAVVTQTGNSVTVVDNYNGATYSGTVKGAIYTISGSYPDTGGTMNMTMNFTLASNTSGSGTMASRWTLPPYYCNTSANVSLTKTGGTPTIPALLLDCAIYSSGGKVSDVKLLGSNWSP